MTAEPRKNHPRSRDDGPRTTDGEEQKAKDPASPDVQHPSPASQNGEKADVSLREYEDLKKRVSELDGLREKFLHAAADFENAKKRNAREKEEFIKHSQERILREMLPALDNFERALGHAVAFDAPDAGEGTLRQNLKSLISGVQMVQKQITDVLRKHGLVRLKTVGEKFDPHLHEVVGHVPEEGEEDRIVDEFEAGYKLHDRLLRAAKVRIRTSPGQKDGSGEKQDEIA